MSVLHVPETREAAERRKWEASPFTPWGAGERPYVYRDYPLMMHKAGRPVDAEGNPKLGAIVIRETVTVDTEDQERRRNQDGFHRNPAEAVLMFEKTFTEHAKLAAELNHEQINKLGHLASAELDAARAAHADYHMPAVPTTPIRKRGRKPRAAIESAEMTSAPEPAKE